MSETVRLSAGQVRPLRTGAPSAHVLDESWDSIHLGLLRDGELISVLSALPEEHPELPTRSWQLYGPFGEGGLELVEAMAAAVGLECWLWADTERPGLAADHGVWTRWTGDAPDQQGEYSVRSIRVLHGLEAVRRRPGMYVGAADAGGIAHLLWELVSNALDEHLAGHASRLDISADGVSIGVRDDGRGIPPECIAGVCTTLHAGATFDHHHPHVHVAAFGLGLAVVSALSTAMVVTVDREGRRYQQVFQRGRAAGDLLDAGAVSRRGTSIRFSPDPAIFGEASLDVTSLRERLRELAHLNPKLSLSLQGVEIPGGEGLLSLAEQLAGPATRRLVAHGTHAGVVVEVAVVWGHGAEDVRGWANQLRSTGSHVDGLLDALATTPSAHRVALVAVMLQEPRYVGKTRQVLEVDAARDAVRRVVEAAMCAPGP